MGQRNRAPERDKWHPKNCGDGSEHIPITSYKYVWESRTFKLKRTEVKYHQSQYVGRVGFWFKQSDMEAHLQSPLSAQAVSQKSNLQHSWQRLLSKHCPQPLTLALPLSAKAQLLTSHNVYEPSTSSTWQSLEHQIWLPAWGAVFFSSEAQLLRGWLWGYTPRFMLLGDAGLLTTATFSAPLTSTNCPSKAKVSLPWCLPPANHSSFFSTS